jgi:hypothetical protein
MARSPMLVAYDFRWSCLACEAEIRPSLAAFARAARTWPERRFAALVLLFLASYVSLT